MKKTANLLSGAIMAAILFSSCQKNNMASGTSDSTGAVTTNNNAINMQRTREFYDSVINGHNASLIGNYCDASFEDHNPDMGQNGKGLDNLKTQFAGWFASMPDVHITIDKMSADGDMVWLMYHMTGTMKGDMGPMKATGKSMNVSGIDLVKIKDGKATDRWGYYDQMGMMQQLGLMPPPSANKPPPSANKKM